MYGKQWRGGGKPRDTKAIEHANGLQLFVQAKCLLERGERRPTYHVLQR